MSTATNILRFDILLDLMYGSCAKGASSPRYAMALGHKVCSAHHAPNAGHTYIHGSFTFVGKALPTPAALKATHYQDMVALLSPGSAFTPIQILQEWEKAGRPQLIIHERAALVLPEHALAERRGARSTKHLASTMQGVAVAAADKMLRLKDVKLAKHLPDELGRAVAQHYDALPPGDATMQNGQHPLDILAEAFMENVSIVDAQLFRDLTHQYLHQGLIHEGSQGYGLSLDHGTAYPYCTSRNVDVGQAMSYMAVPPHQVGRIIGVMRAGHMIRVGNVVEDGQVVGESGPVPEDAREVSWEEIGRQAGMPDDVIASLSSNELTTVTKRLRRVFTVSRSLMEDAIRTNGVTELAVNFLSYVSWQDFGKTRLGDLSARSRDYLEKLENDYQLPVTQIGTGPEHDQCIMLPGGVQSAP